jgi:hypothetical protein
MERQQAGPHLGKLSMPVLVANGSLCHGPCRAQLRYCAESAVGETASLPRCRSCLSIQYAEDFCAEVLRFPQRLLRRASRTPRSRTSPQDDQAEHGKPNA